METTETSYRRMEEDGDEKTKNALPDGIVVEGGGGEEAGEIPLLPNDESPPRQSLDLVVATTTSAAARTPSYDLRKNVASVVGGVTILIAATAIGAFFAQSNTGGQGVPKATGVAMAVASVALLGIGAGLSWEQQSKRWPAAAAAVGGTMPIGGESTTTTSTGQSRIAYSDRAHSVNSGIRMLLSGSSPVQSRSIRQLCTGLHLALAAGVTALAAVGLEETLLWPILGGVTMVTFFAGAHARKHSRSGTTGIVEAWDANANWNQLLNRPSANYSTLDFIRACAVLWVLSVHTATLTSIYATANQEFYNQDCASVYTQECADLWAAVGDVAEKTIQLNSKWYMFPVASGLSGVDLFFFLSGFLINNILAKELRNSGRINVLNFYARRALRIIPMLLFSFGFTEAVMGVTKTSILECGKGWWKGVLGVSNIPGLGGGTGFVCVEQSWTVQVELQFYVFSPFIVLAAHANVWSTNPRVQRLPCWLWPNLTFGLLLATSFIFRLYFVEHFDLSSGMYNAMTTTDPSELETALKKQQEFSDNVYTTAYSRMSCYIVGMFASYWRRRRFDEPPQQAPQSSAFASDRLFTYTGHTQHANAPAVLPPWIDRDARFRRAGYVVALTFAAVGMWFDTVIVNSKTMDVAGSTFFFVFARFLFACGAAYTVTLSLCGYCVAFSRFAALWIFYPIAQLSYSAYLLQLVAFKWAFSVLPIDSPEDVSLGKFALRCLVGFPLTLLLALGSFMIVEMPLMRLRSVFERKK